jgi:acetyl esterase/lipase
LTRSQRKLPALIAMAEPAMSQDLDPHVFRPEAIAPETLAFNADLARRLASQPKATSLQELRERMARGEGPIPTTPKSPLAKTLNIPGKAPGTQVGLRIIAPPEPRGAYLHIHGGGWRLGSSDMWDGTLVRLATNIGLACVSVEYRLAPEHPYPAAPEDCEAAALWLIQHSQQMFGTSRRVIGGESSGAHLAALTLLRLRDCGYPTAFRGANLAFGVYDLSLTPSVLRATAGTLITSRQQIEQARSTFLPAGTDPRDPAVSPLYADLGNLPPALFCVGTLDPLIDDSLFMHARWIAAGNLAELAVYPGGLHGLTAFPGTLAAAANARIEKFLATRAGVSVAPQ